jgi:demethylsterigmatocystin 6-O-methyltransferase
MQPLPKFLGSNGYKTPSDPSNLPFNMAFGPALFFQWLPDHPEVLGTFQQWMMAQRDGHTPWLDFYPFETQVIAGHDQGDPDGVLLVDIGGSMGQEIREIQRHHPDLPGCMVLQDLPSTIEKVPNTPGMVAMSHDFFTPQPILGETSKRLRR